MPDRLEFSLYGRFLAMNNRENQEKKALATLTYRITLDILIPIAIALCAWLFNQVITMEKELAVMKSNRFTNYDASKLENRIDILKIRIDDLEKRVNQIDKKLNKP